MSLFQDHSFLLLADGILSKRLQIIVANVKKNGGEVETARLKNLLTATEAMDRTSSDTGREIVTGLSGAVLAKHLPPSSSSLAVGSSTAPRFLSLDWLTVCLEKDRLLPKDAYWVTLPSRDDGTRGHHHKAGAGDKKRQPDVLKELPLQLARGQDPNAAILEQFQRMADLYRTQGVPMKSLVYRKAIANITAYGKPIRSAEQARQIPGIGQKLAHHVEEILAAGTMPKLEAMAGDATVAAQDRFARLLGVGAVQAKAWLGKGYTEPRELLTAPGIVLTETQRLGIAFEQELAERLSREQVERAGSRVLDTLARVAGDSGAQGCIVGSYSRGATTIGDLDLLVYARTLETAANAVEMTVAALKETGFITHSLSGEALSRNGRYMGICRLDNKHRRIDIWIVEEEHLGAGLINWIGSELFCRSLRNIAKAKGLKLSSRGVEDRSTGKLLASRTEEEVFAALGLPYIKPEDRNY